MQQEQDTQDKVLPYDFKFELALFLILGFLAGFTIKTEASKRITIGFSDYKTITGKQAFELGKKAETSAQQK